MKFETKYDEGENVWCIVTKTTRVRATCPFCDGEGSTTGKDKSTFPCPKCHGDKTGTRYLIEFKVGKMTITDIFANGAINEKRGYTYKGSLGSFDEENIFRTQAKAKFEAERRNLLRELPKPYVPFSVFIRTPS